VILHCITFVCILKNVALSPVKRVVGEHRISTGQISSNTRPQGSPASYDEYSTGKRIPDVKLEGGGHRSTCCTNCPARL
jgi:hypothetical protein